MTVTLEEAAIRKHYKLVHHFARRYQKSIGKAVCLEYEDLVQIGYIGLIKGIRKYDPSLGYKPSTYLGSMISGEILREVRERLTAMRVPRSLPYSKRLQLKYCVTLNAPVLAGEIECERQGLLPDPHQDLEDESNLLWMDIRHALDPRSYRILRMRVLDGYSQREIGERFGVGQVAIGRRLTKIHTKLREALSERG